MSPRNEVRRRLGSQGRHIESPELPGKHQRTQDEVEVPCFKAVESNRTGKIVQPRARIPPSMEHEVIVVAPEEIERRRRDEKNTPRTKTLEDVFEGRLIINVFQDIQKEDDIPPIAPLQVE